MDDAEIPPQGTIGVLLKIRPRCLYDELAVTTMMERKLHYFFRSIRQAPVDCCMYMWDILEMSVLPPGLWEPLDAALAWPQRGSWASIIKGEVAQRMFGFLEVLIFKQDCVSTLLKHF